MAVDVSTLAIEVKSTGIKEASDALGGLSKTAGNLDKKVASLTNNLANLLKGVGQFPGSSAGMNNSMAQIATALQQASVNANATARALAQVTNHLQGMTSASNQAGQAIARKNAYAGVFITTLKAMGTAFLTYGLVKFTKGIIQSADAWQMMESRLTVATGSLNNAKVAQEQIYNISQKLRVPLESTAQLYTRLTPTMQRMGKTHEDVKNVVEGVGLAMKLSGTTAAEASSAMLQLSQSFNAGRLNGAEFNSIAEAAPKLLDAIAEKMKVNVGQLKKMGSEGKITGTIMAEAIAEAKKKWEEDFAKLPVTVDDALTRIKNAWTRAMGELNQDTGMNKGLTEALAVVEKLIPVIRDEMVGAFIAVGKWIGQNKEDLGDVWNQIKGLAGDIWGVVEGVFKFASGTEESVGGVKLLGAAIFGVRLVLAAAVDLVKLIGGSFVRAGADVADFFILPIFLGVKALERMAAGVSWLTDKLAGWAAAAGFGDIAKSLEGASKGAADFAGTTDEMAVQLAGITGGARDLANQWLSGWESGNTEVNKLLNKQFELTEEAKKTNREWDRSTDRKPIAPVKEEDKEAKAAREKAQKDAEKHLEKQIEAYREMEASLAQLQKYGLEGEKRTALQKEQTELELALAQATDKTAQASLRSALAYNRAAQEIEKQRDSLLAMLEAQAAYQKKVDERITSTRTEGDDLERQVATYGMLKSEIDALVVAEEKRNLLAMQEPGAATEAQIAQQRALIAELERVQALREKLGVMEVIDDFNKRLDPSKAEKFGNALEGAFGKAGKAMGLLIKGLENYDKRQSKVDKLRKDAEKVKGKDAAKYAEMMERAREEELEGGLKTMGELTAAAKGMFKEHTAGYKVLEAAERGFRAVEMALAVESFLHKMGLIDSLTIANMLGIKTQVAATQAGATQEVAAKMTVANANAVAGVANQANGDPYSAFARMAVMAAIMAGLGLAVGGIGGGGKGGEKFDLAKHQKEQNTGTVFGDDTAKSESIKKSLELVRDNTNVGLTYSANMVMHLRNIDMSIGGLVNTIVGIKGFTTGKNFGIQTGTTSGGGLFGTGLFGSKTTTDITDAGLLVNGTISDLLAGNGAQQYADITRTKKKWYGKTSTSSWRQVTDAGDDTAAQLGMIFEGISETIVQSVAQLGGNAAAAEDVLRSFGLSFEVSLKDLKGDELAKALEDAISAASDRMANAAFDQLGNFQRVGEGYYETLIRVAYGTEQANDALARLGVQAVNWQNIQNTQGDVGTEMVRESLMAAEAGTSLHEVLRLLDGSMEDLVESYQVLTRLRSNMRSMGLGEISLSLIRGAGGVDALDDSLSNFFENFYSDAEKVEMSQARLRMEFGRLNLAVPTSREAYRSLVEGLLAGGEMTAEVAGRVLGLSEVFNDAMGLLEESGGRDIEGAKDALREAYDREAEALENLRDKMKGFAEGLRDFQDSLIMSDLSTKSDLEKYETALARYNDVQSRAMTGDESAIEDYQNVANELLRLSREVFASGTNYTADFERVLMETEALAQFTEAQADQATQSLELLRQQVDALIELDESVKTVAQAIRELQIVMAGGTLPVDGSHANGLANVPYDGYIAELHKGERVLTAAENAEYKVGALTGTTRNDEALCEEVKMLRQQVQKLTEEQREQTQMLIASNYDANEQNARAVVDGTKQAAEDAAYVQRTQLGLN